MSRSCKLRQSLLLYLRNIMQNADNQKLANNDMKQVLITRPQHQAHALGTSIKLQNWQPIYLPTIRIDHDVSKYNMIKINSLSAFNLVVFVSSNAVLALQEYLQQQKLSIPKHIATACIGPATAKTLENFGITPTIIAAAPYNSESLLTHPALQHINQHKIAIICGYDARQLLPEELTRRGAKVHQIPVYQRNLPTNCQATLLQYLTQKQLDVIICTSQASLKNLLRLIGTEHLYLLQYIKLLVVSQRMLDTAAKLDCQAVLLADNATDEAILKTLIKELG